MDSRPDFLSGLALGSAFRLALPREAMRGLGGARAGAAAGSSLACRQASLPAACHAISEIRRIPPPGPNSRSPISSTTCLAASASGPSECRMWRSGAEYAHTSRDMVRPCKLPNPLSSASLRLSEMPCRRSSDCRTPGDAKKPPSGLCPVR